MPVSVFDHDDRSIDQDANRQRQATKRHDVGTDVQVVHGDERGYDRNGKRDDGNERGTKVEEENDNHKADNDRFLDQIALQRFDGFLNQARTVVSFSYFDSRWQRAFDLGELFLNSIDDRQSVEAVAHHDDAAHGLALSLPFRNAFPHVRAERHRAEILHQDGSSVLGHERDVLQISERFQIT